MYGYFSSSNCIDPLEVLAVTSSLFTRFAVPEMATSWPQVCMI